MGKLIDGQWHDVWYDTEATQGEFVRQDASFRHWVTPDGSPGPSGTGGFAAARGRYHLYVSLACPWAHRTLIFRRLKGLEDHISVSVVNPIMLENGWTFAPAPGVIPDPVLGADYLHQVYTAAEPTFTGRVTVPVLWDKETKTIVSNESSEIIRMLGSAFDSEGATPGDFYPEDLREEIDAVNERVYNKVNNGVYRAGFATRQEAYQEAVEDLFDSLAWLDARLGSQRYLVGDRITEADWRLFPTLIRFDPVYVGHFKCNLRRVVDFPNIWAYTRDLYQVPGIAETVNLDHAKRHYYGSHPTINPTGIIPAGPHLDLDLPHQRDRLAG